MDSYPNPFEDDNKLFTIPLNEIDALLNKIINTEKFLKNQIDSKNSSKLSLFGLPIHGIEKYNLKKLKTEFFKILNNKSLCKEFNLIPIYTANNIDNTIEYIEVSVNTIDKIVTYLNDIEYFKQVMHYDQLQLVEIGFSDEFRIKKGKKYKLQ
jgi:hypothetical protein